MVRKRKSVDIGNSLYNVSILGLCTWFNNVFHKRFITCWYIVLHTTCMSVSYTIAMLRPPPCQSLGKIQCKYINPYICEYIAFKIQRKAPSCLELHFTHSFFVPSRNHPFQTFCSPLLFTKNKMADFRF